MNPRSAGMPFKSPPARRSTILSGHPRNTSAPIITNAPIKKRRRGDDPDLGLKSPFMMLIANDPNTMPIISGLMYSTIGAVWRCSPPAISLTKHAMQNPMFLGFPDTTRITASTPIKAPVRASLVFSLFPNVMAKSYHLVFLSAMDENPNYGKPTDIP